MLVVGVGVFMDAPLQRVVGVVDAECVVFKAHQSVEQVPAHLALLAVVPAADLGQQSNNLKYFERLYVFIVLQLHK